MVIVGDYERCSTVAECLTDVKRTESKRHFLSLTGLYKDVPVSVVCGGMGVSITDFIIREARQVVQGPMTIVRFGSCGIVHDDVNVGDMIVPKASIMVQQNFFDDSGPFLLSKPALADEKVTELVTAELKTAAAGFFKVATGGVVASTDSFYASQGKVLGNVGRASECFDQDCSKLVETIAAKHPNHHIFEMEAHYL